jgi:hypothetical protein
MYIDIDMNMGRGMYTDMEINIDMDKDMDIDMGIGYGHEHGQQICFMLDCSDIALFQYWKKLRSEYGSYSNNFFFDFILKRLMSDVGYCCIIYVGAHLWANLAASSDPHLSNPLFPYWSVSNKDRLRPPYPTHS